MEKTIEKRLVRDEVPVELTWNLADLFVTKEAWETELAVIEKQLPEFAKFKGKLQDGASILLECLLLREQLYIRLGKAGTYVSLLEAGDGTSFVNQSDSAVYSSLATKVYAGLSFINSEILELPDGTVEQYIAEESELVPFQQNLIKLLETKQHRLSAESEEVLASLGEVLDAPYKIYGTSKTADMQFASIEDEEGNQLSVSAALYEDRYEFSPNTTVRRKAYESFVGTLEQYKNTFAQVYSTEVAKQAALSKLRKYDSITEMLLDPQQVSLDMYNNQLDTILTELSPHMQRFAKLKKKVLGLDQMMYCDLKAPLDPEFNPSTTYEEASEVILEALSVMGPEYKAIMEKGLKERWVDLADNVGKRTGAFCSSPYDAHPYILITWQNTMRGAFVLAHELGHAGHFYLANQNQRIGNTRPSMYFIEAPSTMNELLLGQYLLNKTEDKQMRRWVVMQLLGTYYHNFVTHLLEGEYQRRVYTMAEKGKALTAKTLSEVNHEVLADFWGDAVKLDAGASLTWMRQPHYYMGLYPYTYSCGLTASTAVSQLIQEEGKPAVDRWLDVLRAGGTMKPLDLLKHAGVDMSTPEAVKKAVAYVGSLVDELERSYE